MNGIKRFISGIRFRLMSWFTIILALVLIIFSAFVYTRQSQDMQGDNLNRLAVKVRQLENLFQFEGLQSMQDVRQLMPMLVSGGVALVQEDEVLVVSDPTTQWSSQLGPVSNTDVQQVVASAQQIGTRRSDAHLELQPFKLEYQENPAIYLPDRPGRSARTVGGLYAVGPAGRLLRATAEACWRR